MANYGYVAINDSGKEIKGSIEAGSAEKAKSELKAKGLILLSLEEQSLLTRDISADFSRKPSPRDLSVMCRQFVSMTRAGVSILDALRMLVEQTENKRLRAAVSEVRISVEKGETLANSLAEHPKEFPELMVHMVAAGEASGSLEVALERMAVQFEKSAKINALVKKAMIYPVIVALAAVAVVIILLVAVIPSYTAMFEDLGTELPALTLGVMNASNFVKKWWFLLIPALIAAALAVRAYSLTYTGRHFFGRLALKIPILKNFTVKSAASHMSRTLSTLLAAGVPLIEAVGIVSDTMGNVWFKEALLDAREQITVGMPLSRPLESCGLFPPMVYHMVKIGEEAGNTEEMLVRLADYYDEEVEIATQSLMAAMEPIIILVLAVVVGFLVGAVIAPMGKLYETLDTL